MSPTRYVKGPSGFVALGGVGLGLVGQLNYTSNTTDSANQATAIRCHTDAPLTINRIGLYIPTSSGNLDVGAYAADGAGGIPGTRLVSAGSTASPGTGLRRITVAETTIPAGFLWLAVAVNNATISLGYWNASQWYDVMDTDTLLSTSSRARSAGSAFPLPSTWPADSSATIPRVIWAEKV